MPPFKNGTTVNYTNTSLRRGKLNTPYLRISAGPLRGKYVHELVAEAMLGRPLAEDEEVDHLDENGLNPDWRNLEVVTKAENVARRNRRQKNKKNRRERVRRLEDRIKRQEDSGRSPLPRPNKSTEFDPRQFV